MSNSRVRIIKDPEERKTRNHRSSLTFIFPKGI